MSDIHIKIKDVSYDIDLDTLQDQVDFSIIDGRRFVLEGKNKDGGLVQSNLKLNDIFDAILRNHPDVDAAKLTNSYRNLKKAGYDSDSTISTIVKYVHSAFKASDRKILDRRILDEEKASFKEKIANTPDFPDLCAETVEKSLKSITSKNHRPLLGEVQVGTGRYLLRPGKESYAEAKGFSALTQSMEEANYVVNLIEGDHVDNPFKDEIPSTDATVVNFKGWKDETPPGKEIIELARNVVANRNVDKPDMVFCRQGLQRTSTFVAIAELIRNEEAWEQDTTNDTARRVLVTVLEQMAAQDNGRIPTKSQLATLLSNEFINSVRSKPISNSDSSSVKMELLNFAYNPKLDPEMAEILKADARKIENGKPTTRKAIDDIAGIRDGFAVMRHRYQSGVDKNSEDLFDPTDKLLKILNAELENAPERDSFAILRDIESEEKKIKKMIEYKPATIDQLNQIQQRIKYCNRLINVLDSDSDQLNTRAKEELSNFKMRMEEHKRNLIPIAKTF